MSHVLDNETHQLALLAGMGQTLDRIEHELRRQSGRPGKPRPYRNPALSNGPQIVNGGPADVYWVYLQNPDPTSDAWVHLYDTADSNVGFGSEEQPPLLSYWIPSQSLEEALLPRSVPFHYGITVVATLDLTSKTAPSSAVYVQIGVG